MPSKKKPPPDDLLAAAADLRAGGAPWDDVARAVGRGVDTVRRWPGLYPREWARHARAADRRLLAEASAESVHTLRRHLRSADDKASRDAAHKLLRLRVDLRKKAAKPKPASPGPGPPSEFARAAAYLETLTDDQYRALVADLLAEAAALHRGAHPGAPPASDPLP